MFLRDKDPWRVISGDVRSPLMRNAIWVKCQQYYDKELGLPRPVLGVVSKNNNMEYLIKSSSCEELHKQLTERLRKNIHLLRKIINKTFKIGEESCVFTKRVFESNLKVKTPEELMHYLRIFSEYQSRVYTYGLVLPFLDFQQWSFVEGNLRNYLKSKLNNEKASEYFNILATPSEESFSMIQEKDLLLLQTKFEWNKELRKVILDNNKEITVEIVKKNFPVFYDELKKHTNTHCWVYYSYMGPAFTEVDFLEFIKDNTLSGVNPLEKLKKIECEKKELIRKKEELIMELNPDEFNEGLMRIVGTIVWAKPRRKDYQTRAYYYIVEGVMKEIARRLNISKDQALSAPFSDIEKGLVTGEVDYHKLNSLYEFHVIVPEGDNFVILHGKKAKEFSNKIIRAEEKVQKKLDELKGTTACPGNVKGRVKIINIPDDISKMERGDILISAATTPSIVSAMRKAAAIVTDEGGLTCHASIVSRELGTPCIVGTKIVTKVFKDGDMVNVDASSGVIKRLK